MNICFICLPCFASRRDIRLFISEESLYLLNLFDIGNQENAITVHYFHGNRRWSKQANWNTLHPFYWLSFTHVNHKSVNWYKRSDQSLYKVRLTFYILISNINLSQMNMCIHKFTTSDYHFPVFPTFMTYLRVFNKINTTGATSGAGTAYPSGAHEFNMGNILADILRDNKW